MRAQGEGQDEVQEDVEIKGWNLCSVAEDCVLVL